VALPLKGKNPIPIPPSYGIKPFKSIEKVMQKSWESHAKVLQKSCKSLQKVMKVMP
jgi:hypothetical protein